MINLLLQALIIINYFVSYFVIGFVNYTLIVPDSVMTNDGKFVNNELEEMWFCLRLYQDVCLEETEETWKQTASGQNFIPRTPEHRTGMLISTAICCRRILFYETVKNLLTWWRSQWIVINLYWLIKLTFGHIY